MLQLLSAATDVVLQACRALVAAGADLLRRNGKNRIPGSQLKVADTYRPCWSTLLSNRCYAGRMGQWLHRQHAQSTAPASPAQRARRSVWAPQIQSACSTFSACSLVFSTMLAHGSVIVG